MPYVTSIERSAIRATLREGIQVVLELRFGQEGLKLMSEIREVHDEEQLRTILKSLGTVASLDEVRRLCAPTMP